MFGDAFHAYMHTMDDSKTDMLLCLKYLIVCQMLSGKKCVFYTREYKAFENHEEIAALAKLAKAYDSDVSRTYKKSFRQLEAVLSQDTEVGHYTTKLGELDCNMEDDAVVPYRGVDVKGIDPNSKEEYNCSICLDEFGTHEFGGKTYNFPPAVRLVRCDDHYFHATCVEEWLEKKKPTCPVCGMFYGKAKGTMPDNGTMTDKILTTSLPGHEKCQTIQITFNFPSGVQGEVKYQSMSKICYLPASTQGKKVHSLFKLAWRRRHIFKIGATGSLVEDGIELKTLKTAENNILRGYPDASYLDRCTEAFQAKGIF